MTSPPNVTPGPTPLGTTPPVALATPAPTAPTAGRCPILNEDYLEPKGEIQLGDDQYAETTTTTVSTPRVAIERGSDFTNSAVLLRTGDPIVVVVSVTYRGDADWEVDLGDGAELSSLDARMLTDDGASIPVIAEPERATSSNPAWRLTFASPPDRDAHARLTLKVAWHDACFRYTASGSIDAIVRSTATLAACARGDAVWDELQAMFEDGLPFGSRRVAMTVAYASMYFDEASFIESPYGIAMFEADAPALQVAPGATITFRSPGAGVRLALPDPAGVRLYRRAGVIRHIEEGGVTQGAFDPPPVAASPLTMDDEGTFTMTAPTEPGRYVVAIEVPYESDCSVGVAVAGAGLDVVAP